jgi:hypothetical protein
MNTDTQIRNRLLLIRENLYLSVAILGVIHEH